MWAHRYYVSTIGLDEAKVRQCVMNQDRVVDWPLGSGCGGAESSRPCRYSSEPLCCVTEVPGYAGGVFTSTALPFLSNNG